MRYPDTLTIIRPRAADEYGNPGAGWDGADELPTRAFVAPRVEGGATAILPPDADVAPGDRARLGAALYEVADVVDARSPSRTVVRTATLSRIAGR